MASPLPASRRPPARPAPGKAPDRDPGDAPLRGERLLALIERPVVTVEAALARVLPAHLDPLSQPGAAANACLLIAIATGIAILPFYTPSVHEAHASVAAMNASLLPRTLRALHRWSSDAAMAFVLLHAARLLLARRVGGARWLAWTTGALLLGLLGLIGWLGYWLAWDAAGGQVARATASMIDALPLGADPLGRSFVADSTLSSLLFFVVFFAHVLLPLAMAAALGVHVVRTARPRFLPGRALFVAIGAALLAISAIVPAPLGPAARMSSVPAAFAADGWYLWPLALADRLTGGVAMALVAGALIALATLPWTLARGRARVARVDANACNACTHCVSDCPFAAITMAPREPGGRAILVAEIDPARCVGCGICSGSCEPGAIGLPWLPQQPERLRLDAWLLEDPTATIVLGCAGSAAGALHADAATGLCDALPGARVMTAPCAGWFSAYTVERALRRGSGRVIVVGCAGATCRYREGDAILRQRLEGVREPVLRRDRVDVARLEIVEHARTERRALIAMVAGAPHPALRRAPSWLAGAGVAAAFGALVVAVGLAPHAPRRSESAQLAISFSHRGREVENCRDRTPDELAALPPHMRAPRECVRERAPVRLRVSVDGREAHASSHEPAGAWSDGPSVALVTLDVPEGRHRVEVAIGDEPGASWEFVEEREIELSGATRRAVLFDRARGFTWE